MEPIFGGPEMAALPGAAGVAEQAPDPTKVAAVGAAVSSLNEHLRARAAQHPSLADEFREVLNAVKSLHDRFEGFTEANAGGLNSAGVAPKVSDAEARLVGALVGRLAKGRAHLELSYLPDLADAVELAVLAAAV